MRGRRVLLLCAIAAVVVAALALALGAQAGAGTATSGVSGTATPAHSFASQTTISAGCSISINDLWGCVQGAWNAIGSWANNTFNIFGNYLTSFVDGLIVGAVSDVLIGGIAPLINGIANALASVLLTLTDFAASFAIMLGPFSAPIFVGILLSIMVSLTVAFEAVKDVPIVGAFA